MLYDSSYMESKFLKVHNRKIGNKLWLPKEKENEIYADK